MFYLRHRLSSVSTSTYTHRLGTSSASLTNTFGTLFPRFGDIFDTLRFTSVSIFTTTRPPTYLSLTATVSGTLLPSHTTTRTQSVYHRLAIASEGVGCWVVVGADGGR